MTTQKLGILSSRRGTYGLILHLAGQTQLEIGRLGSFSLEAGDYVYVGSAFGPGGLNGRISHHLGITNKPHWHIDYLRQVANLEQIWFSESEQPREHEWAALFQSLPGAKLAVPRFGASDCDCPGHLFYFRELPAFTEVTMRARERFPEEKLACWVAPGTGLK